MTKRKSAQAFSVLEALLRREYATLAIVLLLVTALCWWWIVAMALDMYGPMDGLSGWMMKASWDATYFALLWAMWSVMMAAMMLPSAAPTILLYLRAARQKDPTLHNGAQVYALVAGYLFVWSVFSLAATVLQWALASLAILSPMMESASPVATAVLLLVAGFYQLTPLKRACLSSCRSPLSFLMRRWRAGWVGALQLGAWHGVYCLGCCWALMLLLFAGGVMNLVVIVALTAWVILEKVLPRAKWLTPASGAALITAGIWILLR